MSDPRPIRWLHLSDLHFGCRGRELWWQVHEEFERSVREMVQRLGPPDLLIFSGDLANQGRQSEYVLLDGLLDALCRWIAEEADAPEPFVIAVPGNHDLRRPKGLRALPYRVLDQYKLGQDAQDVRFLDEALWERRRPSIIAPLFGGFQDWWKRRVLPDLTNRATLHRSHFPVDFCVELAPEGAFPLCVVGLNSTWQQYREGDFERELLIPLPQFQSALPSVGGESPLAVFRRCRRALLVMHHPPSWLSSRGRRVFEESIYTPDRFDLCLHGHLHEARSESVAFSGGKPRYYLQCPSLFGLEHYGTPGEQRTIGYCWGAIAIDGTVRAWPLARLPLGSGEAAFVPDPSFPITREGVQIRPLHYETARSRDINAFSIYLEDLVDRTDHLNIGGMSSAGHVKGALRHPIERLYTPLRSADDSDELGPSVERVGPRNDGAVSLADLLPRYPRLLIEGQPGAGKTTFLRFVACMLGRDALGRKHPEGSSWRRRSLGLSDTRSLIPVLLVVADLVEVLNRHPRSALHTDDRRCLLDLLAVMAGASQVSRAQWGDLLSGSGAVLLLDGLDEVADERLRERVFEIFHDACRHWQCRIVVSSRPSQAAAAALLGMGFHLATIAPFGENEIRTFLDCWATALYAADSPEALSGEAQRYRGTLLTAICTLPRVRRLASNPVMLTCLAVVHWNERQLPEGRARVYRAVVHCLIAARTEQRQEAGFTDWFAWRALARLALAMMSGSDARRTERKGVAEGQR